MSWFPAVFLKRKLERELDKELRFHLEEHVDELISAGRTPEEARREALVEFGGLEQFKEACRDERGGQWLENFWRDLGFAVRQLRKAPGLTTTIIATLALGIGAFTTIFSAVDGIMLRPLDVPHLDELVMLREVRPPQVAPGRVAYLNFVEWRRAAHSFEGGLAAAANAGFNVTGLGDPVTLVGKHVTPNYFEVLGVNPFLGRGFLPDEDTPGKDHVVVLSYRAWRRLFNGASDAVGRTIEIGLSPYTVIGVTPESLTPSEDVRDLWTTAPSDTWPSRKTRYSDVWGRLKPGVSLAQAQAEMDGIAKQVAAQSPETNEGWGVSLISRRDYISQQWRTWLWTLLAAAGCLLVIACANVASLLLAQASARQREIAVRAALGASRMRLVRQLLTESLLLGLFGGMAGVLIAVWGIDTLRHLAPVVGIQQLAFLRLDRLMLAFALCLSVTTGILFGLAPAWFALRVDLRAAMAPGGRGGNERGGRGHPRRMLVVAEVALATVLLSGAGLLVRSFVRLANTDPGFVPAHAIALVLDLTKADKFAKSAQQVAFVDAVLARMRALPEVQAVGASTALPLRGLRKPVQANDVRVEGQAPVARVAQPRTTRIAVTPDYFRAVGMRLLDGRPFSEHDTVGTARVAIVNETLARENFPGENPLGRRIDAGSGWTEIVGIVADSAPGATDEPMFAQMFEAMAQRAGRTFVFVARTQGEPSPMAPALAAQIHAVDKDQPIYTIMTLEQAVANSYAVRRFAMLLLALFSAVALTLATTGIYGVMAYTVIQRRVEIGIRIALGGQMRDITGLILSDGAKLVGLGLLIGLGIARGTGRLIESRLFQTSASDPLTFVGISLLFAVVAACACWFPARRASKVDPMVALRAE